MVLPVCEVVPKGRVAHQHNQLLSAAVQPTRKLADTVLRKESREAGICEKQSA